MEMASPRTFRISASGNPSRSRPSNRTLPSIVLPGGDAISRRIESDVTLLPQPDSPTMASVSPRWTEKEMPSTARTTPSRVKKYVFSPFTSRSAVLGVCDVSTTSHAPGKPRVQRIAHSVAEQVYGKHCQRQEDAGKQYEISGDLNQASALGHDVAPAGYIRWRTGSDERKYCLGDHRRPAYVRSLHEQGCDDIGQNVAHQDAGQSRAGRDRGFDVGLFAQRQHEAADETHDARDFGERDRRNDVADACLGQRHQGDREQNRRNRHEAVHHPHDDGVQGADIAGHEADRHAEQGGEHGHGETDDQRHSRSIHYATVNVAPEHVGAEPEVGGRWFQAFDRGHRLRVDRPQPGREDRDGNHADQDDSADERRRVAPERVTKTPPGRRYRLWRSDRRSNDSVGYHINSVCADRRKRTTGRPAD